MRLVVFASAAKQSILSLRGKMDCFAALAMTARAMDCFAGPVIGLAEGETRWRGMTAFVRTALCASPHLIQRPLAIGAVEREGRHVDLEPLAAFADHLITSGHEARRGRQRHA